MRGSSTWRPPSPERSNISAVCLHFTDGSPRERLGIAAALFRALCGQVSGWRNSCPGDDSDCELGVVLFIPSSPKQYPSERTEPAEDVVHVTQIDHLDQVAVEVFRKKERMAARRFF